MRWLSQLVVPKVLTDPPSPTEGEVWYNDTDKVLRYRKNGATVDLAASSGIDAEAVQDIVGEMAVDSSTVDFTYNDTTNTLTAVVTNSPTVGGLTPAQLRDRSTHTGTQQASTISDFAAAVAAVANLDADTLNGQTAAQIQAATTAAIVDTAPGTLDTLNELAAALGDDPNFATTVTSGLAIRSRGVSGALVGGALTEVITHNLNTRDVVVSVRNNASPWDSVVVDDEATTLNTVTLRAVVNLPAGYRWSVVAAP